MKIQLVGHDYRYAAEQLVLLFFHQDENLSLESRLERIGDKVRSVAILSNGKRKTEKTVQRVCSDEKMVKNTIKQAIFLAARTLTDMPMPWGILTGIRPAKVVRELMEAGATEDQVRHQLREEFWVSDEKIDLCLRVAAQENAVLQKKREDGISLYIGIPCCPTRCLYCSFISSAESLTGELLPQYVDALLLEMEHTAMLIEEQGWHVETVYIGGGTPTTLNDALLEKLLSALWRIFDLKQMKEFTVEAGRPDTVTPSKLSVLKQYGVTRLSINPQSMHQITLDKIGRRHTPEDIVAAYAMARQAGFQSINADLIAGLPGETPDMFSRTLELLAPLNPEGITVHTMYIKRASRLKQELDEHHLTAVGDVIKMLSLADEFMIKYGYLPYYMYRQKNTLGNQENVGYAKEGHASLYNIYIMEEVQTVLAMGAGASTKLVKGNRIERIFNVKDMALYIEKIDEMKRRKEYIQEYYQEK